MRVRRPPGRIVTLGAAMIVGGVLASAPGLVSAGPVASADPPAGTVTSVVVRSVPGFSVVSSGPLSAHRFASYDPDPAAVAAALGRLSVGGEFNAYLRTWSGGTSGTALGDVVVTFAKPTQAAAYVSAARASLPAGPDLPPDSVPGVPGVSGVTYPSPYSPAATERVLLFTVGRTAVMIGASEPGTTTTLVAGPIVRLAVDQHRLLVASPYSRAAGRWWNNRVVGWGAVVLGLLALILAVGLVWSSRRRSNIDTVLPAGTVPISASPVDSVPVDSVPVDSVTIRTEPMVAGPGSAPVGAPADAVPVGGGSLGTLDTDERSLRAQSAPVEAPPLDTGSFGAAVFGAGSAGAELAEGARATSRPSGTFPKVSRADPATPPSVAPPPCPALPLPPAGTTPGWLPDPTGPQGHIRYWDGVDWTVHTARPLDSS